MPIYDVGYRRWSGQLTSAWSRWWMIAESGIRIALKSNWIKRVSLACWLPIIYWGAGFLIFERFNDPSFNEVVMQSGGGSKSKSDQATRELSERVSQAQSTMVRNEVIEGIQRNFSGFPAIDKLVEGLQSSDVGEVRHTFWTWMLMTYFRYPQITALIFLLGFVTPSLIARDFRSRGLFIYFSRPIGRWEYIFGKFMVPASFLLTITTLPALVLYVLGVFVSPSITVVFSTWDIPFRILLASIVVIVPTVSLALMLSSLTQESRFATFGWFAVWALGQGAWLALWITAVDPNSPASQMAAIQKFSSISLYNVLGSAQSWAFGFEDFGNIYHNLIILLVITLVSLTVLFRRISKFVHI
jgi:ABC-type transport system involved in multi-copper enzyme maturation permease subunit